MLGVREQNRQVRTGTCRVLTVSVYNRAEPIPDGPLRIAARAGHSLMRGDRYESSLACRTERADLTVGAVKRAHPYEEPVINVIPLYRTSY